MSYVLGLKTRFFGKINYFLYIVVMQNNRFCVYAIVNTIGTIEYIGETQFPQQRFKGHLNNKKGNFYKRQDIFMKIIEFLPTKKEAFYRQCELQKEFGFESDLEKMTKHPACKKKSI
jgi:predicted GIY-YIG superfamily endonuclease